MPPKENVKVAEISVKVVANFALKGVEVDGVGGRLDLGGDV